MNMPLTASVLSPLHGIRVIEICNVAAGPFCAMLLGDLGADVIKLENPGSGDTLRAWPPHTGPENDRLSENFASLNRNKRSITLYLKNPEDNAKAKELIAKAETRITNVSITKASRTCLDFIFRSFSREALKGPLIGFSTFSFLAMMEGYCPCL